MTESRTPPKNYFVKSFGCQMNVYDSERMAELLTAEGMSAAADAESADVVVLNTCHIREKAAEKVYSEIGRLKKHNAAAQVVIAGCVAQAEGEEIIRRAPAVDVVVGPQAYHRLPELIRTSGAKPVDTDMPPVSKFDVLPKRRRQGASAFLTVQEGCDKFCTYCVVPYTRGAEVSRSFAAIMDEARALIDSGAREITLLGQNVNAWTGDDDKGNTTGLDGLIRALDALPDLKRIRYTTSHPNDMTEGLIRAHTDVEKLMPYLHLPVQAGNDRILKAMNRSHDRDSYLRVIERVRTARPDIAISGDFIVGFPGETDAEFEDTLDIVRAANYAQAYSFKYSSRPGTPAAEMDGHLPESVKEERLARLQALLGEQQHAFNTATVGKRTEVLLERPGRRDGQLVGKSPWLQSVHVEIEGATIGDLVTIDIVSAGPNSLAGLLPAKVAA